jgi:transcriptional regulator with XRE-family HTH domain
MWWASCLDHYPSVDDRRSGLTLRALRRRLGLRQAELAHKAGVSQSVVSRAERGHLDTVSLRTVRALFAVVDARLVLQVRWRGGELDYLLDRRHADLGVAVACELAQHGWATLPEVTYVRRGERGSIDLLSVKEELRVAAIFELKSEMTSFEEQQRRLDEKRRVAASVVQERFGWRPAALGVFLVLPATSANRARVKSVAPLIRTALPAGNVEIRRWLAQPEGNLAGIWFVRDMRRRTGKCSRQPPHRVRRLKEVAG